MLDRQSPSWRWPVGYFHAVFSVPAEIAVLAWQNKAPVYDLLFRAAAETMLRNL